MDEKSQMSDNTVLYYAGEYGGIQLELYTQRFRPLSKVSPRGFIQSKNAII